MVTRLKATCSLGDGVNSRTCTCASGTVGGCTLTLQDVRSWRVHREKCWKRTVLVHIVTEKNNGATYATCVRLKKSASLGQCNDDRISGPTITDEASCTVIKTKRTWKSAVWVTSATTACASDPCTAKPMLPPACCAESSVAPSPVNWWWICTFS